MLEPLNSGFFSKKTPAFFIILAVIVVAAGIGIYKYGKTTGYSAGYAKAQADIQSLQEESARKAADEAAKAANPFQAVNPLKGVEANPFEKVKRVLNPFEN